LTISDLDRLRMLAPRPGRVRAVLDTDTYNEIDDQLRLCRRCFRPTASLSRQFTRRPFQNTRSTGPGDGMDKSYGEILRLFSVAWVDRQTVSCSRACASSLVPPNRR